MSQIIMSDLHSLRKEIDKIKTDNLLVVLDEKIAKLYPVKKILSSSKHKEITLLEVKGSERLKTYKKFFDCCEFFLKKGVHRRSHLLAIGGGSVSDFSGFVASSILRGIPWSVIPTSLLSMVDAAIGGKTGLNSPHGKNLVGSFHMPEKVILCPEFIESLPKKELMSGRGEILKYAYLDKGIQNKLLKDAPLSEVISLCAQFKEDIVTNDFKEMGLRKLLNFGHSFGHAYEKIYHIPHGVAVIWGILTILLFNKSETETFRVLVRKLGLEHLKVPWSKIPVTRVMSFLKKDKKLISKGEIDLVIYNKSGNVVCKKHNMKTLEQRYKEITYELEKFSF